MGPKTKPYSNYEGPYITCKPNVSKPLNYPRRRGWRGLHGPIEVLSMRAMQVGAGCRAQASKF